MITFTNKTICAVVLFVAACACATAQNLLTNGDFSDAQKIAGWTLTSSGGALSFYSVDADMSATSGSLLLSDAGTDPVAATSACFPVTPANPFNYGGKSASNWLVGPGSYGLANMMCTSFPSTDCSGAGSSLPATTNVVAYSTPFQAFSYVSGILDANAHSANCTVSTQVDSIGQSGDPPIDSYFDDLIFISSKSTWMGGYMSGNWYDANNSGEGFQLEFTPQQNIVLAIWFTYAPDGSGTPIWIFSQGTYDVTSNSVTLSAVLDHGAQFPPAFKSTDITSTPWGTLTFTFTDCNHGTASWAPTVAGYTAGSMSISRLTSIAGTSCPQ